MSKKAKIINIILLFCMICCGLLGVYTVNAEDFYEVNFSVLNTEEDYTVYWLLPQKYIDYVNKQIGANFTIDTIPGNTTAKSTYISYFNVANAKSEKYSENGIDYLQIELKEVAHSFLFYVAPGYSDMDFKLRYTSPSRDVILHLNEFTYNDNGDCNIKYDYASNDFIKENEIKTGVNKYVVILIVLLAIMCLVNIFDDKSKTRTTRRN